MDTLNDTDISIEQNRSERGCMSRRKRILSHIQGILFYTVLISIVFTAFFFSRGTSGAPRALFGYSAMTVLTSSMQSELPQGCIIIIKEVDPKTLVVGDNITFMEKNDITITHKIVDINKDYSEDGLITFQTQGIENPMPDENLVYEPNVLGKVIFHSTIVGDSWRLIVKFRLIIGVFAICVIGITISLRVFLRNKPKVVTEYSTRTSAIDK